MFSSLDEQYTTGIWSLAALVVRKYMGVHSHNTSASVFHAASKMAGILPQPHLSRYQVDWIYSVLPVRNVVYFNVLNCGSTKLASGAHSLTLSSNGTATIPKDVDPSWPAESGRLPFKPSLSLVAGAMFFWKRSLLGYGTRQVAQPYIPVLVLCRVGSVHHTQALGASRV